MRCENGQHAFRLDPGEWWGEPKCVYCGIRVSEKSIVCICGASAGRDKIKLAHKRFIPNDEGEPNYSPEPPRGRDTVFVTEQYGLMCVKCGYNWDTFSVWGGDWRYSELDLIDICDSISEIKYYEYQPAEIQERLIPQLFVEVAPQKGYFIDWYDPAGCKAIEIDGPHHNNQVDRDIYRDRQLLELGYQVIRIKTSDIKKPPVDMVSLWAKIEDTRYEVASKQVKEIEDKIIVMLRRGENAADLQKERERIIMYYVLNGVNL